MRVAKWFLAGLHAVVLVRNKIQMRWAENYFPRPRTSSSPRPAQRSGTSIRKRWPGSCSCSSGHPITNPQPRPADAGAAWACPARVHAVFVGRVDSSHLLVLVAACMDRPGDHEYFPEQGGLCMCGPLLQQWTAGPWAAPGAWDWRAGMPRITAIMGLRAGVGYGTLSLGMGTKLVSTPVPSNPGPRSSGRCSVPVTAPA